MSYVNFQNVNQMVANYRKNVRRVNRDARRKMDEISESKGSTYYTKQSALIENGRRAELECDSTGCRDSIATEIEALQRGLRKRLTSAPSPDQVALLQVLNMTDKPNAAIVSAAAEQFAGTPATMDALRSIAARSGLAVSGGTTTEIVGAIRELDAAKKAATDYVALLDDPDSWNCFGADRTPKFWAALNSSTRDGDLLSITDATREILENTAKGFVGKICGTLDELKNAAADLTAEDANRLLALQSDALREQWDADRAAAAKAAKEIAPQGETITADTPDDIARRERMLANAPLSAETKAAQSAAIISAAQ